MAYVLSLINREVDVSFVCLSAHILFRLSKKGYTYYDSIGSQTGVGHLPGYVSSTPASSLFRFC